MRNKERSLEELNKDLENLQTLINANKYIKSSNAYIVFNDGYIGDFIFKSLKSYKPSLEEVKQRLEQGKLLSKDINENVNNNRKLISKEKIENKI